MNPFSHGDNNSLRTTDGTAQKESEKSIRTDFETAFLGKLSLQRAEGEDGYVSQRTDDVWLGFKTASASRPRLTDDEVESVIEESGGRWCDGEFRIDGKDLGAMVRALSTPAGQEDAK